MKKSGIVNILFCGIGGQGVLAAAEVCSIAAMRAGFHVKKSEVHGMAQRGGSVESHVRFGAHVYSPLIPLAHADYLVPFFKAEHDRLLPFLKKGGVDLCKELQHAHTILTDTRYLNSYLLGVLSSRVPIDVAHWMTALELIFGNKSIDENKRVFLEARNSADKL